MQSKRVQGILTSGVNVRSFVQVLGIVSGEAARGINLTQQQTSNGKRRQTGRRISGSQV